MLRYILENKVLLGHQRWLLFFLLKEISSFGSQFLCIKNNTEANINVLSQNLLIPFEQLFSILGKSSFPLPCISTGKHIVLLHASHSEKFHQAKKEKWVSAHLQNKIRGTSIHSHVQWFI